MKKQGRIRVRGAPRKDPDLHLIAQVVVMYAKQLQEEAEQQKEAQRNSVEPEGGESS